MMAELYQCADHSKGKEMTSGFILLRAEKNITIANYNFLVPLC